jgi:hypothetical protein
VQCLITLLLSVLQCSSQENLLEGVDLAIPIFHCYGHKASCQVSDNLRQFFIVIFYAGFLFGICYLIHTLQLQCLYFQFLDTV